MFKVKRAVNGQYYWVLIATNGETLCQSETYISKQSALNGIASCQRNAATSRVIDES